MNMSKQCLTTYLLPTVSYNKYQTGVSVQVSLYFIVHNVVYGWHGLACLAWPASPGLPGLACLALPALPGLAWPGLA